MNNRVRRFKDDYQGNPDNVIGRSYKSKIMSGEIYTVKGFVNDDRGEIRLVKIGIRGRRFFEVELRECFYDLRVD